MELAPLNDFAADRHPQADRLMTNDWLRDVNDGLQLELWSLYMDKVAVSISDHFDGHGISSILLKGPAIASWLYRDGTTRPYGDADLMVSPTDWERAQSLLQALGFEKELAPLQHPGMESFASESWVRNGQNVDLHCTLWGIGTTPERVWATLSSLTDSMFLEGRPIQILEPGARAFLLATHAAKHGDGQPFTDLERGIQMLPFELWQRASALAVELDAVAAFVAGLRLVPGGREIARKLDLPDVPLAEASLRAWRVPMALGFEQLAQTSGTRSKLTVMWRELFPTPAFMRWWTPLASRGRRGLAVAYVWRILWVMRHAVPAFMAWQLARRGSDAAPTWRRPWSMLRKS